MPKHVQKQAAIGTISARGFTYVEQDLTLGKMKKALSRKGNTKVKTLTHGQYKELAAKTVVNNDLTFTSISPEEQENQDDIKRFASLSFWKSVKVREGFKEQLKVILPGFWRSDMEKMAKNKIMVELESHLKSVQKYITTDASNNFTSEELENLDEIGKLSKYVNPSNYLSEKRRERKRQVDSIKKVSEANGTTIVYKKKRK